MNGRRSHAEVRAEHAGQRDARHDDTRTHLINHGEAPRASRRPSRQARGGRIPAVFDPSWTTPSAAPDGMHRRPNAGVVYEMGSQPRRRGTDRVAGDRRPVQHDRNRRKTNVEIEAVSSPSEYWRRPRCERRGASCEARRRGDAPTHRRGGATRQMAPRRRNPKGAWGLRPQTASHVVADALRHRLLRASSPRLARPTRAAHANTRTGC